MPATVLAGVSVTGAFVRIDAVNCSSSQQQLLWKGGIRRAKARQDLRPNGLASHWSTRTANLNEVKRVVRGQASNSQDGERTVRAGAESMDSSSNQPTTKEAEGNTKTGSESQAVLPKGASEAPAEGGGGLGDFSLLQTRRFWLGTSVGILAALGGNLVGVTSSIFNLSPQASRSVRADLLFPVKGFKRCLDSSQGFEFIYPKSWVGDQRLLYRAVERAERERSLDLPPTEGRQPLKRASSRDPVVAFGPPGSDGELNVSVVVAPVYPGFSLQKIGGPKEAGELILQQFIAPEGSKKVATLLNAQERMTGDQLYYTLEYSVKGSAFFRHNLVVYTSNAGFLYSLSAQTSERAWKVVQSDFSEIVNSFKLLL